MEGEDRGGSEVGADGDEDDDEEDDEDDDEEDDEDDDDEDDEDDDDEEEEATGGEVTSAEEASKGRRSTCETGWEAVAGISSSDKPAVGYLGGARHTLFLWLGRRRGG